MHATVVAARALIARIPPDILLSAQTRSLAPAREPLNGEIGHFLPMNRELANKV
jgi:hypothetical protein